MAKEQTVFYNNKKCNCKAGNFNNQTNLILNRRPQNDDEGDIPTTDLCDRHTITARTALRNENGNSNSSCNSGNCSSNSCSSSRIISNNNNQIINNDPERTNYQQRQLHSKSHKSHQHRKKKQPQKQKQQQKNRDHGTHASRRGRHNPCSNLYIVLNNKVISLIILLLFINVIFVNCQQPSSDQKVQQHSHHHQAAMCSACSQDKATAKEIQLKYMQQHILARLKFTHLPNMSHVPHVPENIIADFNHATQMRQRRKSAKKYHRKANRDSTRVEKRSGGYLGQQAPYDEELKDYQGDQGDVYDKFQENFDEDYQGDAPFYDDEEEYYDDEDEIDEEEEPFYSVIDKVYVMPTVTTINRKKKHNHTYMLHFTFGALDNGQRKMTVKSAKLMFHVTSAEVKPHPKKEVKFSLYRLTHPRQPNSAEKIQEYSYDIPSRGSGIWQEINMTDMVKDWHLSPDNNHGMILEFKRDWMKNYVAVENGKQSLYLEVKAKPIGKKRRKRQDSLDCNENSAIAECCRYPLLVNFAQLNWDWIIAPQTFEASYCNGECRMGFLPESVHTTISHQVGTQAKPCCSPSKLSAVDLLYFSQDLQILKTRIPNMAVEKCSCS